MIPELWLNFLIVIAVQLALYFIFFLSRKHQLHWWQPLVTGILIGIPFGVVFDLLVGKNFSVFSYHLGFDITFLILNGAFSYGLMIATIILWKQFSFFRFYALCGVLGAIYELVNYASPVWTWIFADSVIKTNAVLIFAAYCGLGLIMAFSVHVLTKYKFRLFRL